MVASRFDRVAALGLTIAGVAMPGPAVLLISAYGWRQALQVVP